MLQAVTLARRNNTAHAVLDIATLVLVVRVGVHFSPSFASEFLGNFFLKVFSSLYGTFILLISTLNALPLQIASEAKNVDRMDGQRTALILNNYLKANK